MAPVAFFGVVMHVPGELLYPGSHSVYRSLPQGRENNPALWHTENIVVQLKYKQKIHMELEDSMPLTRSHHGWETSTTLYHGTQLMVPVPVPWLGFLVSDFLYDDAAPLVAAPRRAVALITA